MTLGISPMRTNVLNQKVLSSSLLRARHWGNNDDAGGPNSCLHRAYRRARENSQMTSQALSAKNEKCKESMEQWTFREGVG